MESYAPAVSTPEITRASSAISFGRKGRKRSVVEHGSSSLFLPLEFTCTISRLHTHTHTRRFSSGFLFPGNGKRLIHAILIFGIKWRENANAPDGTVISFGLNAIFTVLIFPTTRGNPIPININIGWACVSVKSNRKWHCSSALNSHVK